MQRLKNALLNNKLKMILSLFVVLITLLLFINDYLSSLLFQRSFYLKESLLFKVTILLLLIPVLFHTSIIKTNHKTEINIVKIMSFLIPITILHVLIASYIIQFISINFLDMPFTFSFLIQNKFTQDFVFILTTYGLMYLITRYYHLNARKMNRNKNKTLSIKTGTKIDIVDIVDIDWISAETPYIALWIDDKKYLYRSTMTEIIKTLDHSDFIRIHKSTIVNLDRISSFKSRSNGDYDIELYNNVQLRLSRTYRTPEIDSQLKL